MRRSTRWIVATCALLGIGGAALLWVGSGREQTLWEVRCAVSLRVVDALSGLPVHGAEVFAADESDVHDAAWRDAVRGGEPSATHRVRCPKCYARTDASGFVVVETVTRHSAGHSGWQELAGTVPDRLTTWSGVSLWIVSPTHLPHVADHLKTPLRERPRADGLPGTVVVLDLGTIALEPEGP